MSQGGHFRAHGRRQVDLPATLHEAAGEAPRPILIVNLSLGGACIERTETMTPGTQVTLEILTPTLWDPLSLPGRVVWSTAAGDSPPRIGLHFDHREPPLALALFELLGAHDYDL